MAEQKNDRAQDVERNLLEVSRLKDDELFERLRTEPAWPWKPPSGWKNTAGTSLTPAMRTAFSVGSGKP